MWWQRFASGEDPSYEAGPHGNKIAAIYGSKTAFRPRRGRKRLISIFWKVVHAAGKMAIRCCCTQLTLISGTIVMVKLLGCMLAFFAICAAGVHPQCFAQADDTENGELVRDPINEFELLSTALVTLRLKGENIVYRTTEFVPIATEKLRPVIVMKQQIFTVMVRTTEVVNGKRVTKMRPVEKKRFVPIYKMARGQYRVVDVPVDKDCKFLSLDGKEMDRKRVAKKIGMNEKLRVVTVPVKFKFPNAWQRLFKDDTIILQFKKPLKNQRYFTRPVQR